MEKLARSKKGKCLSSFYIDARTKLLWQCANEHKWMATPSKIRQGQWCRQCAIELSRLSSQQITELIQSKGGELITQKYYRTDQNLEIKCQYGHMFLSSIDRIKRGNWCKYCSRDRRFLGIDLMHQFASQRAGKCLSREYRGIYHELEWECSSGHRWMARPDNIRQGKWCPNCASFKSERKTRFIFEQLTGFSFIKTRKILSDGLELDGYCHELKLAFEYQGQQHYEFLPKFYYKTRRDLEKLQLNDKKKKEECIQLGIKLVEIPYFENTSDVNLEMFIKQNLIALNINMVSTVDFIKFYSTCSSLKLARELAYKNGGKLLSNKVQDHITKLRWQCKNKHKWDAPLQRIQQGAWCRLCANKKKSLGIDYMKNWAKTFNGYCLSSSYTNGNSRLKWRCRRGHEWEASYYSMKVRRCWCLEC